MRGDNEDDDDLYTVRRRLELARSAIVALQSRVVRLEQGQRALRAAASRAPTGTTQTRRVTNAVRIKETAGD